MSHKSQAWGLVRHPFKYISPCCYLGQPNYNCCHQIVSLWIKNTPQKNYDVNFNPSFASTPQLIYPAAAWQTKRSWSSLSALESEQADGEVVYKDEDASSVRCSNGQVTKTHIVIKNERQTTARHF